MVSEKSKHIINSLSLEELLHEVMKGSRSRFTGEKYDYLLTRYALLNKQNKDEHNQRVLEIGNEANEIAKAANKTSSKAFLVSVFAVIVAIIALIVAMLKQG